MGEMTIPADLSPHLHTEECNFLIRLWEECKLEKSIFRQIVLQECDMWYQAAAACFKQERLYRRETNERRARLLENRRLPEERYTRMLKKLKAEGKLNFDKSTDKGGCCNA